MRDEQPKYRKKAVRTFGVNPADVPAHEKYTAKFPLALRVKLNWARQSCRSRWSATVCDSNRLAVRLYCAFHCSVQNRVGESPVVIRGNEWRANNFVTYVASDPSRTPVIEVAAHDPARFGPQVVLANNPFWNDFVQGYLHSLSPLPVNHPDLGQVYQPAWYGDGQKYWSPDFIQAFGPLGR